MSYSINDFVIVIEIGFVLDRSDFNSMINEFSENVFIGVIVMIDGNKICLRRIPFDKNTNKFISEDLKWINLELEGYMIIPIRV